MFASPGFRCPLLPVRKHPCFSLSWVSRFVNRFPFLDWMRGLAVLIMIQCHTFNSLVRLDLRDGGPYTYSQFVGGMAAPLFLFMAGMTTGFQMESLSRREPVA